jgi:hypothetical protein
LTAGSVGRTLKSEAMKLVAAVTAWALCSGCAGAALLPVAGTEPDTGVASPADAGGGPELGPAGPDGLVPSGPRPVPPSAGPGASLTVVADLSSDTQLRKMWGSSEHDLWLVGGGGWAAPGPTLEDIQILGHPEPERIVHFDGANVREVPAPASGALLAIWGSSARDVWAAGDGAIIHFDGTSWSRVDTSFTPSVYAIWGSSASDVWFAGDRQMRHWDGSTWRDVAIPGGSSYAPEADVLLSLWGFSANDVWAGGGTGTLIHWDGATWTTVHTGSTLYVYGLWGASPADLWGVGNGGYRLRWTGTALDQVDEGYTGFNAVRGHAPDDVWGVGSCCWDTGEGRGWVSHFDGAAWTSTRFDGWADFQDVWVGAEGTVYALVGSKQLVRLVTPR